MWDLLKESGYTDEQLIQHIKRLDAVDGVEDGRNASKPNLCSKCGSAVPRNLARCQFCGTETGLPADPLAGI